MTTTKKWYEEFFTPFRVVFDTVPAKVFNAEANYIIIKMNQLIAIIE